MVLLAKFVPVDFLSAGHRAGLGVDRNILPVVSIRARNLYFYIFKSPTNAQTFAVPS